MLFKYQAKDLLSDHGYVEIIVKADNKIKAQRAINQHFHEKGRQPPENVQLEVHEPEIVKSGEILYSNLEERQ